MHGKIGKILGTSATALALALGTGLAYGAAGDWLVRGRVIDVSPNDSSGEVTGIAGSGVAVDSKATVEVDATYMITNNWGVEVIAATTKHDLKGKGTVAGLDKIGDVGVLPPTVTLQYHFAPDAQIRPYAGVGVNYTHFYSESTSSSLDTALGGPTSLSLDSSWGLAGDVGADFAVGNDGWFINVDAKYIKIDTTATLNTGGTIRKVDVTIDPWVWGIGVGKRF